MAHAIVEWTDNLVDDGFEVRPVLELIARTMREADGVFPLGGIRVRAVRLADYIVADDAEDDAFINVTVLMGAGRDADFKQRFFGGLFDDLKQHRQPIFDRRFLALSMYVNEADETGSFKQNNIHTRFRKVD